MRAELVQFVRLLPEPSALVDAHGTLLVANDALLHLLGADAHLAGARLHDLIEDDEARLAECLRLFARSRQLVPGSLTWRTPRGPLASRCDGALLIPRSTDQEPVIFIRCRPKDEPNDQFTLLNRKVAALTREIVQRKKAEHERDLLLRSEQQARQEAERVSRIKDEFLATLSHELRTPLNAILGWAHVLQSPSAGSEQLAKGLQAVERNARAQAQIIADLLDMSRIAAGNMRLDVQTVLLPGLVEAALDAVRPAADAKSIRLQVTLDPLAGPVKGDPGRLQQVLWNLLSNAIKFTPKQGRVQILLERVNSHVELTVADNGQGIGPEFLPHLFERFQQADSSTARRHGGLGLGLSIARHLVELHGGTIRAKSAGFGQGASFIVTLPVMPAHVPAAAKDVARDRPPSGSLGATSVSSLPAGLLRGLRVMVVDDEPDARELLRALLNDQQVEVALAAGTAQALEMAQRWRPQVILCDIGMPERDGYDFIRSLRALPDESVRRLPAVAVTAFARSEDRTRAVLAGFSAHLAKPLEPIEMLAMLASLAGRI